MNRLRLASRRTLAIAASAFIGLVGAVVIASPAQAHHTYVNGTAECPDPETGEWVVTWTVTSWQHDRDEPSQYRILSLDGDPDGAEVTGIPIEQWRGIDESFTGQQVVPADAATATLEVLAEWNNQVQRSDEGRVSKPEPCDEPEPAPVQVDATPTCDALTVNAANPDDGEEAEVTFSPSTGEPVAETLAPGESTEHSFEAGDDGLTVAAAVGDEEPVLFEWEEPADCDEPEGGEGGGDEELPVTGLQSGLVIGGALLMLTLGAGLFLLARRHRITFTA